MQKNSNGHESAAGNPSEHSTGELITHNIQAIMDAMPLALFVKDAAGRIVLMNKTCEEQWGCTFEQIQGTDGSHMFPTEQMAAFAAKDREVFASGQQVIFEESFRSHANNEQVVVQTVKKPLYDTAGKPLCLIGMSLDITERDHLLQEYQTILRTAQDGFWLNDTQEQGRLLDVNDALCEMLGYTREEMLQMSISDIEATETQAETRAHIEKIIRVGSDRFETRHRHKDGHLLDVEVSVNYLPFANGRFFVFVRDLTAQKQAEKAEAANIAKSSFLANMSHEIRTPLNAILGMTQLLMSDQTTPLQIERLKKIDAAGQHLVEVIDSILDLSKIEAGKFELDETAVNVEHIIASINAILFPRAQEKGLKLITEIEPPPSHLLGDPVRIKQALLNYATNAIKFTETGTITLRVKPERIEDECVTVRFEVEDTGIGIADNASAKIFSAFEQLDNSITRKYGGTGLGLAITKRLAQMMGGDAGVMSTAGTGSTFWFTVTLKKAQKTGKAGENLFSTAVAADAKAHAQSFDNLKILVVEDEPINREISLCMLNDMGATTDCARDGVEAVKAVQQNNYDLILMDMQMPNMDGLEATRRIRQHPAHTTTPILAMTANAFVEDKIRCLEAGMNDFITKPFRHEFLLKMIMKWLPKP